ncbi:AI-2E family transporter [Pontibacillus sp. ALD_SL1]|uniref:AI-2E family transporter n=1 Tax=Pontibacillus sp. ALD_SL1 TaxID=2777185 RepID=UPI001A973E98|nr:AI-2E family transporter [Pontibacillus sp. ALD_SL1]QSS98588.1 AI-2E family transporter [Pontibacillus sp. ALD_SL1]
MWFKHPFFKYATGTVIVLIGLYILELLGFFGPIKTILKTLFYPILIAGFLFYILRPIVSKLTRTKIMNKTTAILTVFLSIVTIIYAAIYFLAGTIQEQVKNISSKLPEQLKKSAEEAQKTIEKNDMGMVSVPNLRQKVSSGASEVLQSLGDNVMQVVSAITGATTVLVIVPFILFYFLKDDHRFIPYMLQFIPDRHNAKGKDVLRRISETVSAYITGQVIVALVDGVLMYIGYLILGLDYALILGIFVSLTAVVPFFGPIIGVIPAVIVALTQDPAMALYVIITLIIVQQLEGNLVAPLVLGKRLNIHPITIILLLIVASALYGFIGMLVAIPLYSVIKVVFKTVSEEVDREWLFRDVFKTKKSDY